MLGQDRADLVVGGELAACGGCFGFGDGVPLLRCEGNGGKIIVASHSEDRASYPASAKSESCRGCACCPVWSVRPVGYSPVKQWSVNCGRTGSRAS
jgi:hypothetical protein